MEGGGGFVYIILYGRGPLCSAMHPREHSLQHSKQAWYYQLLTSIDSLDENIETLSQQTSNGRHKQHGSPVVHFGRGTLLLFGSIGDITDARSLCSFEANQEQHFFKIFNINFVYKCDPYQCPCTTGPPDGKQALFAKSVQSHLCCFSPPIVYVRLSRSRHKILSV